MRRYVTVLVIILGSLTLLAGSARAARPERAEPSSPCVAEATHYRGWEAERLANRWVTLIIVPQLGGRLMQVSFGGHEYLFVNPLYLGKYFPPSAGAAQGKWFNYGGDKIWPLPEGDQDENHWPGGSDVLDDGEYKLHILSSGETCTARLEGPPDERTGLEYVREVSLRADSPRIAFHALMKNITGHAIRWSVQSVTQYNTADPRDPEKYNRDFWAFTPANPASVFNRQFDAHSGPVDHPSYAVRENLFTLHWCYLEGEVGVDSPADWLAVVDGMSRYAMVERSQYQPKAEYPERASVIFYISGPSLRLDSKGMPEMTSAKTSETPYYMEAELNSPLVTLAPGESYALDTEWFPTRMGRELTAVTDAGVIGRALSAHRVASGLRLTGSFGVFYSGYLVAHWYSSQGVHLGSLPIAAVSPLEDVSINQTAAAPPECARVSLHLLDEGGSDRGTLAEVHVAETHDK